MYFIILEQILTLTYGHANKQGDVCVPTDRVCACCNQSHLWPLHLKIGMLMLNLDRRAPNQVYFSKKNF